MPVRDEEYMQEQRQRIIEAAFRCFSRQGFQKTSIRAICKEAGMAVGTLYIHFKDRNEILSSMKLMAHEKPLENIDFNSWPEFCDYLVFMVDIQNNPSTQDYANCDLKLAAEALGNEDLAVVYRNSIKGTYQWIRNCLTKFVADGEIELPLGVDATARSLRYLINGIVFSQIFEDPDEQRNLAQVFKQTLNELVVKPACETAK